MNNSQRSVLAEISTHRALDGGSAGSSAKSSKLGRKAFVPRGPMYINWNYTYACNFRCIHCYSRADRYPQELSQQQYMEIVEQLGDIGAYKVFLGGGEPFLRKDCLKVISRLSAKGLYVGVTTHGWWEDVNLADKLKKAGLSRLLISLDSANREKHDRFRNRPGSYDHVLKSSRAGVKAGLHVHFSTVISLMNMHEVDDIADIAESLEITGVEYKRFRPAGNGALMKDTLELSPSEVLGVRQQVKALSQRKSIDTTFIYGEVPGDDSSCPCGVYSICLRPNGDLSPCAYGDTVIGNIIETPLAELWKTSPHLRQIRDSGSCVALKAIPCPSNPLQKTARKT